MNVSELERIVMKKLAKSGESLEELLGFLVEHILELLYFKDKVDVMNYIYSIDKPKKNSFEWFSKNYFEKHTINVKKILIIYFSISYCRIWGHLSCFQSKKAPALPNL